MLNKGLFVRACVATAIYWTLGEEEDSVQNNAENHGFI